MKDEIIDSLKQDIHKVVDSRNKELEDRKRRELNLTIFNLKEHSHDVGRDNKTADEQDIIAISASLGLDNLNITTSYRLGKREQGKTRPLKIILDSKAQRKFLLDNAGFIASKTTQRYQRVIISKDLTAEQRKEHRERVQRRQQLRGSQRQIETNLNPSSDEDYVRATDRGVSVILGPNHLDHWTLDWSKLDFTGVILGPLTCWTKLMQVLWVTKKTLIINFG